MSRNVTALESVVVFTPEVRIWSGRVSVRRAEDLVSASGLPPEALVSDGAKRVVDPKVLTQLESQRRFVNRYLARVGIRSSMGFLVSPDAEDDVHAELEKRRIAFDDARRELVDGYDVLCAQWERANPGFEWLLRRNRPTAIEVAAACEFDYATYRLTPADSEEGKKRFQAVGKAATSALIDDITSSANTLFRESFSGRETVTQRAVNVVRDLVGKLRRFGMFDPRVGPTADALEKVISGIPHKGPLDPTDTLIVGALVRSMTDPEELLKARVLSDSDDEQPVDEGGVSSVVLEQDVPVEEVAKPAQQQPRNEENTSRVAAVF